MPELDALMNAFFEQLNNTLRTEVNIKQSVSEVSTTGDATTLSAQCLLALRNEIATIEDADEKHSRIQRFLFPQMQAFLALRRCNPKLLWLKLLQARAELRFQNLELPQEASPTMHEIKNILFDYAKALFQSISDSSKVSEKFRQLNNVLTLLDTIATDFSDHPEYIQKNLISLFHFFEEIQGDPGPASILCKQKLVAALAKDTGIILSRPPSDQPLSASNERRRAPVLSAGERARAALYLQEQLWEKITTRVKQPAGLFDRAKAFFSRPPKSPYDDVIIDASTIAEFVAHNPNGFAEKALTKPFCDVLMRQPKELTRVMMAIANANLCLQKRVFEVVHESQALRQAIETNEELGRKPQFCFLFPHCSASPGFNPWKKIFIEALDTLQRTNDRLFLSEALTKNAVQENIECFLRDQGSGITLDEVQKIFALLALANYFKKDSRKQDVMTAAGKIYQKLHEIGKDPRFKAFLEKTHQEFYASREGSAMLSIGIFGSPPPPPQGPKREDAAAAPAPTAARPGTY
jgi:hypothetical protein